MPVQRRPGDPHRPGDLRPRRAPLQQLRDQAGDYEVCISRGEESEAPTHIQCGDEWLTLDEARRRADQLETLARELCRHADRATRCRRA
jgi:hypothetical protein